MPIEKGDTAFASDLTGCSNSTKNIIIWDDGTLLNGDNNTPGAKP